MALHSPAGCGFFWNIYSYIMSNYYNQSKSNKVAATQGTITAQNPNNQSNDENKILGVFTIEDLQNFGSYAYDKTHGFVKPKFYVDFFKRLDRLVDSARIPSDTKGMIKSGFGFLGELVPKYRYKYEPIYQNDDPVDIEEMEDFKEALICAEYEIGSLVTDIFDALEDNEDGFNDDGIEEALEMADDYYAAIANRIGNYQDGTDYDEDISYYINVIDTHMKDIADIREHQVSVTHYRNF